MCMNLYQPRASICSASGSLLLPSLLLVVAAVLLLLQLRLLNQ